MGPGGLLVAGVCGKAQPLKAWPPGLESNGPQAGSILLVASAHRWGSCPASGRWLSSWDAIRAVESWMCLWELSGPPVHDGALHQKKASQQGQLVSRRGTESVLTPRSILGHLGGGTRA